MAVKLSPYFSSTGEMALALDEAGADGLVLFNRFLQPDIDSEAFTVVPTVGLSSPSEAAYRGRGSPSYAAGCRRRSPRRPASGLPTTWPST